MNQRLIAAVAAVPLVLGLILAAALMPLPFVVYAPGYTVDVLAKDQNEAEIIQVVGHKTYRDGGELRMTTVLVTAPETKKTLFELMSAWADPDDAVYPYDDVHGDIKTDEQNRIEGEVQMFTSQESAIAVAQRELGLEVTPLPGVAHVDADAPADGKLLVRDLFLKIGDRTVKTAEDVVTAIQESTPGEPLDFVVLRDHERKEVTVTPERGDNGSAIGIVLGTGFRFPFDVSVNISPDIGGPSAGLMFSLAIYDTLTPGSLTDDEIVAGTGEIAPDGRVGPIGGIQQKVVAARDSGAELFLVPEANCEEALQADNGDMQLVLAQTMHTARLAIEEWADDRDAALPSCEDVKAS
ncbi:MAG TPA: S16 family serine protease [Nocardioides sp.]|nr:S16 family serine protease [Nocardioides sp.]